MRDARTSGNIKELREARTSGNCKELREARTSGNCKELRDARTSGDFEELRDARTSGDFEELRDARTSGNSEATLPKTECTKRSEKRRRRRSRLNYYGMVVFPSWWIWYFLFFSQQPYLQHGSGHLQSHGQTLCGLTQMSTAGPAHFGAHGAHWGGQTGTQASPTTFTLWGAQTGTSQGQGQGQGHAGTHTLHCAAHPFPQTGGGRQGCLHCWYG